MGTGSRMLKDPSQFKPQNPSAGLGSLRKVSQEAPGTFMLSHSTPWQAQDVSVQITVTQN